MPIRVVIAEDEAIIRLDLKETLEEEGYEVVGETGRGDDAIELIRGLQPDLAILDIGVPDGNGFDVCRAIRRTSDLPIVFLTARSEEIDRVLGLELGADDYVSKPFSPREVCARVKAILRRTANGRAAEQGATLSASGVAALRLDETAQRISCGGNYLALTRYEYLLLATLLRRPGRIFSRAELMDLVWADAPDTLDRTVDAHIKLLRAKLRERGVSPELIQTHRHMGYSLTLSA